MQVSRIDSDGSAVVEVRKGEDVGVYSGSKAGGFFLAGNVTKTQLK